MVPTSRPLVVGVAIALLGGCGSDSSDDSAATTAPSEPSTSTAATPPTDAAPVELVGRLEPTEPYDVPIQLEVDETQGRVYVTDTGNGRIVVFSVDGTEEAVLTAADGPFQFQLEGPVGGVDVDADGNIYVAETTRARIVKLASDGTQLATFQPAEPFGRLLTLTVDRENGLVYASDDFADQFVIFDTEGAELGTLGSTGADPGQIDDQGDLAVVSDGTLWIADWGNGRLQHLDPDGSVLEVIGPFPAGTPGAMGLPNDVAIDGDGRLWVADVELNEVLVFEPDGTFVTSFGGTGDPDLPRDPVSLEFDADGLLYVADRNENAVLVLRPTI